MSKPAKWQAFQPSTSAITRLQNAVLKLTELDLRLKLDRLRKQIQAERLAYDLDRIPADGAPSVDVGTGNDGDGDLGAPNSPRG